MSLKSVKGLLAAFSILACTSVFAAPLTVDITGAESHGYQGDADNTVWNFNVGANANVVGISYSFNVTAYRPSWLSEIAFALTDSAFGNGVLLNPGVDDDFFGTASYSNSYDLVALGLDFSVGADGILRLEFYEDFDDFFGGIDGIWNSGYITFDIEGGDAPVPVPEPATALLLAGGLALMGYGRRRRAAKGSAAIH